MAIAKWNNLFSAPVSRSKAALKIFGETLAKEESEVTTVSVLPGIVDTEMQTAIREKGERSFNIWIKER
jgi:NAD(P)-dependent dehydrogenase (short-subunit alcohol dehydrogenase family)